MTQPSIRARYAACFEPLPVAILALERANGHVVSANAAARALFGDTEGPTPLGRLIGVVGARQLMSVLNTQEHPPRIWLYCTTVRGRAKLCVSIAHDEAGDIDILTVTVADRSQSLHGLDLEWETMYGRILGKLPIGVEIYDQGGFEIYANSISNALFDYGRLTQQIHIDDWWKPGFPDPEARHAARLAWWAHLDEGRRQPGGFGTVELTVRCRDEADHVVQFWSGYLDTFVITVFWDVTDRRRMEAELRELAERDALTGVLNRRSFFREASARMNASASHDAPVGLIMLDIDRFKQINDSFGHTCGDAVLTEVARRCASLLPPEALFARMGGEEFAALLPHADESACARVADRLIQAVGSPPVSAGAATLRVQASAGVAATEAGSGTLDSLIERADRALYAAKRGGRNRVVAASSPDLAGCPSVSEEGAPPDIGPEAGRAPAPAGRRAVARRPPPAKGVRILNPDEVAVAVDWAAREGWNPGLTDAIAFRAQDPGGFLGTFVEGELAACISAMRYGDAFGFIGFYICRPDLRGNGHGLRVWHAALDRLGNRTVGLDGVVAQQDNYARAGFRLAHRNIRYGGRPVLREAGETDMSTRLCPIDGTLLPATLVYDRSCFKLNRPAFLPEWLAMPNACPLAAVRDGGLVGYAMLRRCLTGHKIGPLFADDADTARTLFHALLRQARAAAPEAPVFLDVPEPNEAARRLAEEAGLAPVFETARMYRGNAPGLPLSRIYGITSFELG